MQVHGTDLRRTRACGRRLGRDEREPASTSATARSPTRPGGRRPRRRRRARSDARRDDRPRPRARDARHRRSVRGGEGGARRLLPARVRVAGRRRSTGPRGSPAPSTAPSRCARSTSIPRRRSCEVRAAHLRRRLRLGSTSRTRRGQRCERRSCRAGTRCSRSSGRPTRTSSGYELRRAATAKVVRVRDGERLVTDGPFAETKEILGGVFLVELPDLDEAIRLAALDPAPRRRDRDRDARSRPIVEHDASSRSSARSGAVRSRSSPASSATSSSPRTRCRTPSRRQSSAGRATACPATRAPGSSRPPATAPSTGSVAIACSARRRSSSAGSRRCLRRRTT